MTIRAFLPYADRRLHTPAAPVEAVTDEIRAIWDDMIDTMEAMPGMGLAAPQIGVLRRVFVQIGACDLDGLWRRHSLTKPAARIAQHETDRLDSRLIVDSPA